MEIIKIGEESGIEIWKAGNYVIIKGFGGSKGEIMMTVSDWELLKKSIIEKGM